MIRPGEEWGTPARGPADVEVAGGDAELAAAVTRHPGALFRFRPDATSDLAGAVGLGAAPEERAAGGLEVALDVLRIGDGPAAVNMVVLGSPPDRLGWWSRRFGTNVRIDGRPVFHGPCTTVVVATGQFRAGLDVVPRGHPGDGRAEIQIYAVRRRDRRALRGRLATGTHVPHPDITQRAGSNVTVSTGRSVPLEADGRPLGPTDVVDLALIPGAYRLLL